MLTLWARVLQAVERSRLLILAPRGSHRQRTLDLLAAEGVEPDRVDVRRACGRGCEYLELYHRIDLGLDTFPYNGHTTSMDSFWMGVPVVTLAGQTAVGRAGVSLATNLGLPRIDRRRRRAIRAASRPNWPATCRGWPSCARRCEGGCGNRR